MNALGNILRTLRKEKGVPLRTVASFLDIDQAILSKIERGQRRATKEQIIKLAAYFGTPEEDLLVAWLSEKVLYEVGDDSMALKALQVAEERISYRSRALEEKGSLIRTIQDLLKTDGRVSAAWLFGSVARDEERADSDVDLMVELNDKRKYSMFDLLDLAHIIGQKINRKVDLVEKGYLRDFAMQTAREDLVKIYG